MKREAGAKEMPTAMIQIVRVMMCLARKLRTRHSSQGPRNAALDLYSKHTVSTSVELTHLRIQKKV